MNNLRAMHAINHEIFNNSKPRVQFHCYQSTIFIFDILNLFIV